MFTLVENRSEKGKELRSVVVETLQELMKSDDKVIALEADLGGASGFTKILKSNPDRFIQCGIAEANMVGVSAGLSVIGFKPFMHTFGPFATRRVFDQIFLSGAYAHTTLNIYGSDPGFCVGANGGTHTTWEDVALMRTIPNAIICDPADEVQLAYVLKEYAKMEGIHYVRANRKSVRKVYNETSTFTIGKGNVLQSGNDVLIIVAGQLVSDALDCAEKLAAENISVEVIDMFTIKPLDKELILKEASNKKLVVTFENHSITGGLGSAVSEVLCENKVNVAFKRVGVDERFGQVGTPEYLQKEFQLTSEQLETVIKEHLCK
ncbi:MAG: alpha-ketoacid dehydrogenase subunit beta [Erysipelotrichia bacterium]|nr:alpha-ketoacid dehydrogenase subunit beta [Erysipelotrichia bacterium]